MTFEHFCSRIEHLGDHRPGDALIAQAALLMASAVLLIQNGKMRSRWVLLDGALTSTCEQLQVMLSPTGSHNVRPDAAFHELAAWKLLSETELPSEVRRAFAPNSAVRDALARLPCAELDAEVFSALFDRTEARRVLTLLLAVAAPTLSVGAQQQVLAFLPDDGRSQVR